MMYVCMYIVYTLQLLDAGDFAQIFELVSHACVLQTDVLQPGRLLLGADPPAAAFQWLLILSMSKLLFLLVDLETGYTLLPLEP